MPGWVTAPDPGRTRLTTALTIASAVLISALISWLLVSRAHVDHGALAVGAFLPLQAGLSVKDPRPRDRLITTALMAVPLFAALTAAAALTRWPLAEVVVFVAIGGLATWLRSHGHRASALGSALFFGYFYGLVLRPTMAEVPGLYLVVGGAVAALLATRLATFRRRPERRLRTLLEQVRATCSTLVRLATVRPIERELGQLDELCRAVDEWQGDFSTERYTGCTPTDLAERVLAARLDVESLCTALHDRPPGPDDPAAASLAGLQTVLAPGTSPAQCADAGDRARTRLAAADPDPAAWTIASLADRAALSQARLRTVRPSAGRPQPAPADGAPVPLETRTRARPHWPRLRWDASARMTLQVMTATALATGIGAAISAHRWYWAVLTAFLVFVGSTTRGAILTRASYRVAGTATGVVVGSAIALLLDGDVPGLIATAVVGVFCMLYFGPVKYSAQTFFITVVLVALYGLLGVLNRHVLELRVVETVAGAVTGVVCAYVVFSTNSRSTLSSDVDEYFAALDALLARIGDDDDDALLQSVHHLDSAAAGVHGTLTSLTVSLIDGRRSRYRELSRLMDDATRHAERVADHRLTGADATDPSTLAPILDRVRAQAAVTHAVLCGGPTPAPVPPPQSSGVARSRDELALAALDTALRHAARRWAPDTSPTV